MKDGMKNGYSKIDLRCTNLSSLIMGDVESDEHLRIFKCLIDTGSLVLRNAIGIKLLNNNSISFVQYLENNKHQFYHQFEKRISRKCCLGSPHGCVFNGTMDKHIFYKMYTKRTAQNTRNCLDRFEINASISLDILDLSDLYFLLWNSRLLSTPDENSLKKIMFIRSEICHPPSSRSYSIVELKRYWSDLESAVLVFAEPKCYKDIVEMQIKTLQNCNLNALESAKIIEKISTESDKIMLAIQQETPLKIVDIEKLIKDGICGFENCVKSENNKTKSYINDTFQDFKENIEKHHEVLSTRCREEIQTTVTQESSNTRLHSEDQRRAIDSKLTESEQRVCQTVIQSQGRLEDKLIEEQHKTRNHTVELKADLIEENRILKDEVMDVKTELKELKTILIGYIGKQKVDLVMNTDQIEKSIESPENRRVDFTARVNQTHVTAYKENKIIENLPPEIKIQTKNDCLSEEAVTETIEITGKKVNSIILELKATPGILHSVENFKAAILTLVQVMQTAGGIDVDIEDTVTVNLKFESPLTEDQFVVVKCLFANKSNSDSDTIQLSDECSSISDEYLSTADVEKIESHSELDIYSQKETSEVVQPNSTEALTEPSCKYCDDRDKIIRTLKEKQNETFKMYTLQIKHSKVENSKLKEVVADSKVENSKLKEVVAGVQEENRYLTGGMKGLPAEISKLKDDAATTLVNPFQDDIGMISITEKLEMKQKISTSDDFNSSVPRHTYGLPAESSKLKLVNPFQDDFGMISKTEKLGMKQKISTSDDFSSSVSKHTYGLPAEISKLKLVNPFQDDIGMISKTEKLGMIQKISTSDDFSSSVSKHTYDSPRRTHIDDTGMLSITEKLGMKHKDLKSHGISSLKPQQTHYLSSKTVDECRNCYEKDEIIIQLDRRLCKIRRRGIEAKKQSVSGNNVLEDLLQFIHQTTNMTSVEEKERMTYKELKSGISSKKSELISDVDVRDPEKKANKKLMESQASQSRRPELDKTEEKGELSLRISEIRREYASSYYTKTDKQKGLGIILQEDDLDPDTAHLQEFFEEIGFVTCTDGSDWRHLFQYMTNENVYCVFFVFKGSRDFCSPFILNELSQRSIGKPVIIMTDSIFDCFDIRKNNEDNEILLVMPMIHTGRGRGPYGNYGKSNMIKDFVKATRRNRFADIMDILTRMNALYDYPVITFQSFLRKKFCFL